MSHQYTGYEQQSQGGYQQPQQQQQPPSYNTQTYGGYDGYNQQQPLANQGGYGGSTQQYPASGQQGGGYDRSGGYSRGSERDGGRGGGYGGGGGGGGGAYGGRGDSRGGGAQVSMGGNNTLKDGMIIQEDTVFVAGLPKSAQPSQIAEFFGKIGVIKTDKRTREAKIWMYKDRSGESKGECTVTYEDCDASQAAVSWFNGKEYEGNTISVSIAQRKIKEGGYAAGGGGRGRGRGRGRGGFDRGGRGGGRGRGGGFGGDRDGGRDGDWTCSKCQNTNFARRSECNRCGEARSDGGGGGGGGGGDRNRDRGRGGRDDRDSDRRGGGYDRDRDRSDRRSRPY